MKDVRLELLSPEWAKLALGPYNDLVVTLIRDGVLAGCIEIEFMHHCTELTHWFTMSPTHPQWAAWLQLSD